MFDFIKQVFSSFIEFIKTHPIITAIVAFVSTIILSGLVWLGFNRRNSSENKLVSLQAKLDSIESKAVNAEDKIKFAEDSFDKIVEDSRRSLSGSELQQLNSQVEKVYKIIGTFGNNLANIFDEEKKKESSFSERNIVKAAQMKVEHLGNLKTKVEDLCHALNKEFSEIFISSLSFKLKKCVVTLKNTIINGAICEVNCKIAKAEVELVQAKQEQKNKVDNDTQMSTEQVHGSFFASVSSLDTSSQYSLDNENNEYSEYISPRKKGIK